MTPAADRASRPRRTLRAFVVVMAIALAGCVGPSGEPPGTGDDAVAPPPQGPSGTWFLAGPDALGPDAPTGDVPDRIPVASFPRTWGARDGFPTFTGAPLESDSGLRITGGNVTLFAEPRGVALSTTRFVEWIAYVGAPGFPNAAGVIRAEAVHMQGEVREITIPIAVPAGGSVVFAGEPIQVIVFPVQTQDDAADPVTLDLLVNARATDARVVLETAPWNSSIVGIEGQPIHAEGSLTGSAYAGEREGFSSRTHPFDLPDDAIGFVARLDATEGAPFPDLDLAILGPDGSEVASSGTPYSREAVRVVGPGFATYGSGGPWAAKVAAYGAVVAQYTLTITPLLAPSVAEAAGP